MLNKDEEAFYLDWEKAKSHSALQKETLLKRIKCGAFSWRIGHDYFRIGLV